MNIFNIINISSIIINTKITDITTESSFFSVLLSSFIIYPFLLSAGQSLEIFPKRNEVATISESFALNL